MKIRLQYGIGFSLVLVQKIVPPLVPGRIGGKIREDDLTINAL